MLLRPRRAPNLVIHCRAQSVTIYKREDWENNRDSRNAVLELDPDEAAALTGFLAYSGGPSSKRPIHTASGVNVEYDF